MKKMFFAVCIFAGLVFVSAAEASYYYDLYGRKHNVSQDFSKMSVTQSINIEESQFAEVSGKKIKSLLNHNVFSTNISSASAWKIYAQKFAAKGVAVWPVVRIGNAEVTLNGFFALRFKKGISFKRQKSILLENNLEIVENEPNDAFYYLLKMKPGTDAFLLAAKLYESGSVVFAQPDWSMKIVPAADETLIPNDTNYDGGDIYKTRQKWVHERIMSPYAWALETGSENIKIAVIDTGFDLTHEDLKDNMLANLGKDFVDNDNEPLYDKELANSKLEQDRILASHGTMTAGLAAAKGNNNKGVTGVCWDCGIIPIRLIGSKGETPEQYASNITNSMKYAADSGASVINNSWVQDKDLGIDLVPVIDDAVNYVTEKGREGKGTVIVWAAGNNYSDISQNQYYKNRKFIVVSAINYQSISAEGGANAPAGNKATYSNYGLNIDVCAPGGDSAQTDVNYYGVPTTDITGSEGGETISYSKNKFQGTSASTPLVAGAVALMLAQDPEMTYRDALYCVKKAAAISRDKKIKSEWLAEKCSIISNKMQTMTVVKKNVSKLNLSILNILHF